MRKSLEQMSSQGEAARKSWSHAKSLPLIHSHRSVPLVLSDAKTAGFSFSSTSVFNRRMMYRDMSVEKMLIFYNVKIQKASWVA